jgi:hypothetical protein
MPLVSDGDEEADQTPRRFRTLHPNPLRDISPWVVVAVGILQAVRGGIDFAHGGSPVGLLMGIGLTVVGIIAFLVYRWLARRGL